MSQSVFLCVEGFMFAILSWLSVVAKNMNKNLIWSIFVVCEFSLYLLPMETNIVDTTYDMFGGMWRSETGTTRKKCILIIIHIRYYRTQYNIKDNDAL